MPDSDTSSPDERARAVQYMIASLQALPDDRFDRALGSAIMDDDTLRLEAFRSAELAERTERALDFMVRTSAARVRHSLAGDAARQKRFNVQFFINKAARERAAVRQYLMARDAQQGILRNRSNPRRRAMERLAQLNMQGDVPQGTFRRLYEEEREKDAEARRQQRREAKQRAKEMRGQRSNAR